eukprot:snap_masked-scaffold_4-processed-gene-8.17-mRNA-1 protein AED:1.00 eAED:1.00 QI:0/-1/0/0/-1/1/1/0/61
MLIKGQVNSKTLRRDTFRDNMNTIKLLSDLNPPDKLHYFNSYQHNLKNLILSVTIKSALLS